MKTHRRHIGSAAFLCWLGGALFSPAVAGPHVPWQSGHRVSAEVLDCIIHGERDFVVSWLGSLEGSSAEQKLARHMEITFPACFLSTPMERGWTYAFDDAAMRAAFIQAIILPRSGALPEDAPAGLDRPAWFGDTDEITRSKIAAEAALINNFGFCVAKTNWNATRDLLQAAQGSEQEARAIAKLTPVLGGCVPESMRVTLDRPRLRTILTEAVFHALGPAYALVPTS